MNCVRYRLAAVAAAPDDRLAARPINVMGCHEFYKHIKRFVIARVENESRKRKSSTINNSIDFSKRCVAGPLTKAALGAFGFTCESAVICYLSQQQNCIKAFCGC